MSPIQVDVRPGGAPADILDVAKDNRPDGASGERRSDSATTLGDRSMTCRWGSEGGDVDGVPSDLVDLTMINLNELREIPADSVLSRSVDRILREAAGAGEAIAGFNSSI